MFGEVVLDLGNRASAMMLHFFREQDVLGRWSFIPVLAIGLCVWTRWITRQEGKVEQDKLEEVIRWWLWPM